MEPFLVHEIELFKKAKKKRKKKNTRPPYSPLKGQPAGSEGQPAGSEGQPAGSEGQPEGGRMDGRTDGRTDVRNFSPFYRTSSPVGAAALLLPETS